MIPSQIISALQTLIPLKQPVFLWGAPGVGKSQVVSQVAAQLDYELRDIRAVLLDPVDLRGLPRIDDNNQAHWCQPSFLPTSGQGILFLDELNAAPPLVQAACYQLVLDRRLGEYILPSGWAVVAAGNRESDRAVTHRMPSALANRFVHLQFDPDLRDWENWAFENEIPEQLIAFLRFRPDLLHDFDPACSEKAFPSPRSWEFVARILNSDPGPDICHDLFSGTVGEGAAAELSGFLQIYEELPDVEQVLENPAMACIPDSPATLYALCQALAKKAAAHTAEKIIAFGLRLPPEFSVLLVRDAVRQNKTLVESPAFESWACAHSEVLM